MGNGFLLFMRGSIMRLFINLTFAVLALVLGASAQEKIDRDTVYTMSPVTTTAIYAMPRISPVTFSNVSRTDIQTQYSTQDVPALLSELPSVTFYSENGNAAGGYSYMTIRGFDQRRLSVMVNGVPQNDPEDQNVYWIDFPDLLGSTAALQVQRGAGSAFYGPPAIGGSVNLIAIPFQSKPGVTIESSTGFQEYGSSNTVALSTEKSSTTFNSGLVDNRYMFYGRLGNLSTDGYRDKSWDDINSYFFGVERIDQTMVTRIHLYGGPFTDGLVYNGLPKFYNSNLNLRRTNISYYELNTAQDSVTTAYLRRPQEAEQFSQPHFELLNDWKLTPTIKLNNTFFYIQGDGYYDYADQWADTSTLRLGSAYGIPATGNPANVLIRAYVGNKQWGWLPRLEIDQENGSLTVGAEIRIHRSVHWGKISYAEQLPADMDPEYRFYQYNGGKDIVSLYGHDLLKLDDKTTLMADIQFAYSRYLLYDEKFLDNSFSVPYFFVNPRFGFNYNADDRVNVYADLAYTSREPRLGDLYPADEAYYGSTPNFAADTVNGVVRYNFSKPLVKPEHLLDFELGCVFQDGHNQASVNFYWMEFNDELVKTGQLDVFGNPVLINADRSRHVGIEVQGQTDIAYGFSVNANAAISYNRIIHCSVIDSTSNGITYRHALDGNPTAGAPDYTANLHLSYSSGNSIASLNAKYVGSFYTDNTKNDLLKNDAYIVCDLSLQHTLGLGNGMRLKVRAEVRNLFDNLYTMYGEGDQFFPAAERNYVIGFSLQI